MNLYEMTAAANELYALLTADEIDEETVKDTLEAMGSEEKLESCCVVIRELEADAEKFKKEKDRLAERQKTAENGVKRIKSSIIDFMQATGTQKSKAGVFAIALSSSKAVVINSEADIPTRFLIEQPAKIDKAAIRSELMAGGEVAGAELQTNTGVRIK